MSCRFLAYVAINSPLTRRSVYIQCDNAVMQAIARNCHAFLDRSNAIPKPVSSSATPAGVEKEGRDTISLPFSRGRARERQTEVKEKLRTASSLAPRRDILSIDVPCIQPSRFAAAFCNRRPLKNKREPRVQKNVRTYVLAVYNPLRWFRTRALVQSIFQARVWAMRGKIQALRSRYTGGLSRVIRLILPASDTRRRGNKVARVEASIH